MTHGSIQIGATQTRRPPFFNGYNPATGEAMAVDYSNADTQDVDAACALAADAAPYFSATSPDMCATFLEAVAEAILTIGNGLIETAMAQSGLPRARLEGERARTVGQLHMFAAELRRGAYLDVTIDPAMPDRAPPRADLRRMNVAVGPVAVFGASNFPLAFSVAGGDTASAFAAGCPVVVKGHPAPANSSRAP